MGCFLACFTASNRKRKYLMDASPSKHNSDGANEVMLSSVSTINQQDTEEPITEFKEKKLEEQLSCNGKKKVTFNLNDRSNEGLQKEVSDNVIENNEEKVKESSNESKLIPDLISSDEASNPPNNRYQNYRKQEFEDLDLEDSGLDGSRDNVGSESKVSVQAESSDSLFSISIDSRTQISIAEVGENEVSSPLPKNSSSLEELKASGSNQNAQNRIENLSQCRAVKKRSAILPLHNQDKENNNVERGFSLAATLSEEPSFRLLSSNGKVNSNGKAEISVDTSLSSWLIQSEITTPLSKNSANSIGNSPPANESSPRSHKDRNILGELSVNTLKHGSASTTPRQKRSQTPDDMPIIGTIGSYWHHTGRNVYSDSNSFRSKGMLNSRSKTGDEDEIVKWNSTPFEAKLESPI